MVDILELVSKAQSGDKISKETIVKENLQLVWSIVRRIHTSMYDKEDLFQVGCIGLMKAIDNYDTIHNAKFSTYAYIMIISEIKIFIRDDNPVKISRRDKELFVKIKKERERFEAEYNREPKISELARNLKIPENEVTSAIEIKEKTRMEYLYSTIYKSDGTEVMLIDKIKSEKEESERADCKILIEDEIRKLDKEERQVLVLRYYKDKKQDEIAKMLNMTQVQVSRIERRAIGKMREDLGED